jgi:hypothetical protein
MNSVEIDWDESCVKIAKAEATAYERRLPFFKGRFWSCASSVADMTPEQYHRAQDYYHGCFW